MLQRGKFGRRSPIFKASGTIREKAFSIGNAQDQGCQTVRGSVGCARALSAAMLLGLAVAAPAVAQGAGDIRSRKLYLSGYVGQWMDANIADIPYRVVTSTLKTRSAYFLSGDVGYVLVPRFEVPLPFCGGCVLHGNSIELEGVVLKHFDQQRHWEIAGGAFLRTGQIPLFLGAEMNFAGGGGLSYALADPKLENGRGGRGVDNYRLQIYPGFETEFTHEAVQGWSLVGRIHHRSGGFGLLTEQGSGSNLIGLGVRRGF
jgi:hypothetical protein